jgi:transposase
MRTQNLLNKPSEWLEDAVSRLSNLDRVNNDNKKNHSLFKPAVKYLSQATSALSSVVSDFKTLRIKYELLEAENNHFKVAIAAQEAEINDLKTKKSTDSPDESACAPCDNESPASPEASTETFPEASPEASTETSTEASPEASPEASTETSTEASPEASTEASTEATPEASTEASTEATPEASTEASTEATIQALRAELASLGETIASLKRKLAILETKSNASPDTVALQAEIACLKGELASAQARITELENKRAAPRPNSKNSHLPSGMDLGSRTSPKPKKDGQKKRKPGAQYRHEKHVRKKFDLSEADVVNDHEPENIDCPECGKEMVRDSENDTQFDQIDIPPVTVQKIIHRGKAYCCNECQTTAKGEIPQEVKNQGFIGARLAALIVILKVVCSVPMRKIMTVLNDVFGAKISLGIVNNTLKKVALTVRAAYEEVQAHVKDADILNIDETGHRHRGKRLFTWVFSSVKFVFYKIGTRTSYILEKVLGDSFKGTIICDYYAAYGKFVKNRIDVKISYCWVHLKRDAKNCSEYLTLPVREFGEALLILIKEVFDTKKARSLITDVSSQAYIDCNIKLRELENQIKELCRRAPQFGKAKGISLRFCGEFTDSGYFTFIDNPEIELSNNAAEQSLRFIVTDRKVCFGTRSMLGIIFCQVMWTAWRTLVKQDKSFYEYLVDCQESHNRSNDIPSLINPGQTVPPEYKELAIEATREELELEKRSLKAEEAERLNAEKADAAMKSQGQKMAA